MSTIEEKALEFTLVKPPSLIKRAVGRVEGAIGSSLADFGSASEFISKSGIPLVSDFAGIFTEPLKRQGAIIKEYWEGDLGEGGAFDQFFSAVGSTLPYIASAGTVGAGLRVIGASAKVAQGTSFLSKFGRNLLPSVLESLQNAGSAYELSKSKEGWDESKRLQAAWGVFGGNLILNSALNASGFEDIYSRLGKGSFIPTARIAAKKLLNVMAIEGGQEGAQQLLQNIVLGDPYAKDVMSNFIYGASVGGLFGSAGIASEYQTKRKMINDSLGSYLELANAVGMKVDHKYAQMIVEKHFNDAANETDTSSSVQPFTHFSLDTNKRYNIHSLTSTLYEAYNDPFLAKYNERAKKINAIKDSKNVENIETMKETVFSLFPELVGSRLDNMLIVNKIFDDKKKINYSGIHALDGTKSVMHLLSKDEQIRLQKEGLVNDVPTIIFAKDVKVNRLMNITHELLHSFRINENNLVGAPNFFNLLTDLYKDKSNIQMDINEKFAEAASMHLIDPVRLYKQSPLLSKMLEAVTIEMKSIDSLVFKNRDVHNILSSAERFVIGNANPNLKLQNAMSKVGFSQRMLFDREPISISDFKSQMAEGASIEANPAMSEAKNRIKKHALMTKSIVERKDLTEDQRAKLLKLEVEETKKDFDWIKENVSPEEFEALQGFATRVQNISVSSFAGAILNAKTKTREKKEYAKEKKIGEEEVELSFKERMALRKAPSIYKYSKEEEIAYDKHLQAMSESTRFQVNQISKWIEGSKSESYLWRQRVMNTDVNKLPDLVNEIRDEARAMGDQNLRNFASSWAYRASLAEKNKGKTGAEQPEDVAKKFLERQISKDMRVGGEIWNKYKEIWLKEVPAYGKLYQDAEKIYFGEKTIPVNDLVKKTNEEMSQKVMVTLPNGDIKFYDKSMKDMLVKRFGEDKVKDWKILEPTMVPLSPSEALKAIESLSKPTLTQEIIFGYPDMEGISKGAPKEADYKSWFGDTIDELKLDMQASVTEDEASDVAEYFPIINWDNIEKINLEESIKKNLKDVGSKAPSFWMFSDGKSFGVVNHYVDSLNAIKGQLFKTQAISINSDNEAYFSRIVDYIARKENIVRWSDTIQDKGNELVVGLKGYFTKAQELAFAKLMLKNAYTYIALDGYDKHLLTAELFQYGGIEEMLDAIFIAGERNSTRIRNSALGDFIERIAEENASGEDIKKFEELQPGQMQKMIRMQIDDAAGIIEQHKLMAMKTREDDFGDLSKTEREAIPLIIEALHFKDPASALNAAKTLKRDDIVKVLQNPSAKVLEMANKYTQPYLEGYSKAYLETHEDERGEDIPIEGPFVGHKFSLRMPWQTKVSKATLSANIIAGRKPLSIDILQLMKASDDVAIQGEIRKVYAELLMKYKSDEMAPIIVDRRSKAPKRMEEDDTYYIKAQLPKLVSAIGKGYSAKEVWIHPDVYQSVMALYDVKSNNGVVKFWEMLHHSVKYVGLRFSLFHVAPLSEASAATGSLKGLGAVWNPANIWKNVVKGKNPLMGENYESALKAARRGVVFNDAPDLSLDLIKQVEVLAKDLTNNSKITETVFKLNRSLDSFIFYHTLNLVKLNAFNTYVANIKGLNEIELVAKEEEIANMVNAQFGGQNWLRVMNQPSIIINLIEKITGRKVSPVAVKQILDNTLFAHDWTRSVIQAATAPFKGTVKAIFGKTEVDRNVGLVQAKFGAYWLGRNVAILALITTLLNYLTKGNPPWENEPGHETDIFLYYDPDTKKNVYMYLGKQFREIVRWGTEPGKQLYGKSSPVVKELQTQLSGSSPYWKEEDWKSYMYSWESVPGRMLTFARQYKPMIMSADSVYGLAGQPMRKGTNARMLKYGFYAIDQEYERRINTLKRETLPVINRLAKISPDKANRMRMKMYKEIQDLNIARREKINEQRKKARSFYKWKSESQNKIS